MSHKLKEDFDFWYNNLAEDAVFDLKHELLEYCKSDVDILRRSCMKFREELLDLEGIDPFQYVTIARVCMAIYRTNYLPTNTVAVVKANAKDQFSYKSLRRLKWMESQDYVIIKSAVNGGEYRIDGLTVDGFCVETNTVYEFHGCYWHGCPKCFGVVYNHTNEKPMSLLFEDTLRKTQKLRDKGYIVKEMWECDFDTALMKNPAMIEFLESHSYVTPLDPRAAFYGGRTETTQLVYNFQEPIVGKYVDFTSLYPWVNSNCEYPVGQPTVINDNFGDIQDYFGFIKCRILPPKNLYHPVLPLRVKQQGLDEKLMFTLCVACATGMNIKCRCDDKSRSFIGTWTTVEVQKAISLGYKIQEIFEIWHFERRSNSLFRKYINKFLKIKQEASGYPNWVKSDQDKKD
jgi:G:T-mismatch repair DNA endonuclease (very short patch repair protein)